MADLPSIYAPIQCGHCFASLEYDEGWTCNPCGLYWPDSNPHADAEPMFLDDEAEPCGDVPESDEREHDGYRFWSGPCTLPEGHASEHHYPRDCAPLPESGGSEND